MLLRNVRCDYDVLSKLMLRHPNAKEGRGRIEGQLLRELRKGL